MTEVPDFLTVPQLVEKVQISDRTIREAIHAGELQAVKVGSGYRIDPADVMAWLDSRKVTPIQRKRREGVTRGTDADQNGFRKMAS